MLLNYLKNGCIEAGCDEAGRGCLAGPVFAAAVIWPAEIILPDIDDSKKLTAKKRESLREKIEKFAISYAVAYVEPQMIEEINILNASILAMHHALDRLNTTPDHILIDGNRFKPYPGISHTCIIGGDGKFASIAAASILAKTYRDDYMFSLHKQFPDYGWNTNKGYATFRHREVIKAIGLTPHHRLKFCRNILNQRASYSEIGDE